MLWVVFLSRVIDGLTAGNLSLAQAYIADVTAPKDRAKSFGVIGIAFGIGFLVGPAVSGSAAAHAGGPTAPVYLAAALSALSILCTAVLLPREPPRPERSGQARAPTPPRMPGGKRLALLDWGSYAVYFRNGPLARLLLRSSSSSRSPSRPSPLVFPSTPSARSPGTAIPSAAAKSATSSPTRAFSESSCRAV